MARRQHAVRAGRKSAGRSRRLARGGRAYADPGALLGGRQPDEGDRGSLRRVRLTAKPPISDLEVAEEIVALVVGDDEGREVLDLDAPDRFHPELRVFQHLDLLDDVLRQDRRRPADRAEIEALMLLAGIDDLLADR